MEDVQNCGTYIKSYTSKPLRVKRPDREDIHVPPSNSDMNLCFKHCNYIVITWS
jgi:hypothetical protein